MQDSDRSAILRMAIEGIITILLMLVTWSVGGIKENLERTVISLTSYKVTVEGLRDQALIMHNNINRLESIQWRNNELINDLISAYRTTVRTPVSEFSRNGNGGR